MMDLSSGDSVTVTTKTINDGEPFEGRVLTTDRERGTLAVVPQDLPHAELVFVGFSEVE